MARKLFPYIIEKNIEKILGEYINTINNQQDTDLLALNLILLHHA